MEKDEIKTIAERYADIIIDDRENPLWQMVYVAYFTGFALCNSLCAMEKTSDEDSNLNKPHVIGSSNFTKEEALIYLQEKLFGLPSALQHTIFEAVYRIEHGGYDIQKVLDWYHKIEELYCGNKPLVSNNEVAVCDRINECRFGNIFPKCNPKECNIYKPTI